MRGKRILALMVAVGVTACSICGCGVMDWAKSMMNNQVKSIVLGEAEEVESISSDRYAYQHLEKEEQIVYDQVLHCILEHKESVPVSTKDAELLQKVYNCVFADYGGLFWVSGYQYNTYTSMDEVIGIEFAPKYIFTKEETEKYQAEVDAVVEEWLAGISPDDSDYVKSKYVFEKLINEVEYERTSENNQNILSVFLGRETVCQGYADATQYLLQQLGIQCMIVRGEANGESHAWNLVCLDREYYLTDTTWGNSRYMTPDLSVQKSIDYQYLNATSAFMSETHEAMMEVPLPECTSTEHHFYQ